MAETGTELLGTADLAERYGYSPSGIRKLEALGVLPKSVRVAGRRAWKADELELKLIDDRVKERRADRARAA